MILTADSDKLGLNIGIRLKNRQTGNFSKIGFSSDMVLVAIIVIYDPELVVSEVFNVIGVP